VLAQRAAVPWAELPLPLLLQGSRGDGELQRGARVGAELAALPSFVAGDIGNVVFQLSPCGFLYGEKELRGLTDGFL